MNTCAILHNRLISIVLWAVMLFGAPTARSQDLGANFNENIGRPIQVIDQLNASKVRWVRGFVNVPRYFLVKQDGRFAGVKEQSINNHINTKKFVDVKKASGGNINLIMSVKIPFENFTHQVPKPGTAEMGYLLDAIEQFLVSFNLGDNLDIFTMGNEPMWENGGDVDDYGTFLNLFADTLAVWKQKHNWDFMVFAGSLNRVAQLPNNKVIPEVIRVAKNNDHIDGLDLHIHASNINQPGNSLEVVREDYQFNKKLTSTEISVVRVLNPHLGDTLGSWGESYGYASGMKMYEWLNHISARAAEGNPVDEEEFRSFFHTQSWYPNHWYRTFYEEFKKHDTYAVTGRFVSGVGERHYSANSKMWDLGAIYSGTFMGKDPETGLLRGSPIVYPEFKAIIDSLHPGDPYVFDPSGGETKLKFRFSFDHTLTDSSENAYELQELNAPVYTGGKYGSAVELDGAGYFDLKEPHVLNPFMTDFTAGAWVYNNQGRDEWDDLTSGFDEEQILHQLNGRVVLHHLVNDTNSTLGTWTGGQPYTADDNVFQRYTWQHVAVVSQPGKKKHTFYVNGEKVGEVTNTANFEYNTGGFRIGSHKNGEISFWHGLIDEVFLYQGALDEEQINRVMHNDFDFSGAPDTTTLVHHPDHTETKVYPNPAKKTIHVSTTGECRMPLDQSSR